MDLLTPEEQAAIDAFPVEEIQEIPTGESGLPELIWHQPPGKMGELRQLNADGSLVTKEQALERMKRGMRQGISISIRRGKIRGLCKDMTVAKMAQHLSISENLIRRDLRHMGLKAFVSPRACQQMAQGQRNLEAVKEAMKTHKTVAEIVKATGLVSRTVRRHMKRIEAGK